MGWAIEKSHLDTQQRQGLEPTLSKCRLNPLNTELNPICHLLTLLGAHHILHVSRVRVKDKLDAETPFRFLFLFGHRKSIGRYLKGGQLDEFSFGFGGLGNSFC